MRFLKGLPKFVSNEIYQNFQKGHISWNNKLTMKTKYVSQGTSATVF